MRTTINLILIIIVISFAQPNLWAQTHTQSIHGTLIDQDSKTPLIGATIGVKSGDKIYGATTDIDGDFHIKDVPVGRLDVEITYLGYDPIRLNSIMLTSGKELNLNIEMQEATEQVEEVVVTADNGRDKGAALNEMATVSARSFSVEETGRYAGSFGDPSRMASNYAGVSVGGGTYDMENEIVIRGNSPSGMLWRMEGIEIPNPNHFANIGSSGGAISMLNSNTLSTSDFLTGAFPSEYGNATAGVFDLNLRNGNNQKHEFSIGIGLLGIEASAEGYFSKKSKASFLINYRYSTLGLVRALKISPVGDVLPTYQDVSFKINVPTGKAGTFSLWGIGGDNLALLEPKKDSSSWDSQSDSYGYDARGRMGVTGLTHRILLSEKSYLKTIVAVSASQSKDISYNLDPSKNYDQDVSSIDDFNKYTLRATTAYTHKFNAQHTLKVGAIFNHYFFNYDVRGDDGDLSVSFLNSKGNTQLLQGYAAWKFRPHNNWTINAGLHYNHLTLNNNSSIEPRLSAKWQMTPKHSVSLAGGMHSRMEDISYYFIEYTSPKGEVTRPNKSLELQKSVHAVLAYDFAIATDFNLKLEGYYQHLYDVPVENDGESVLSSINATSFWDLLNAKEGLTSTGIGRNYGIDLTFEKFFTKQYYFLLTASVFDSKYQAQNGEWYNTRFNTNYQITLLGGKEFKIGKKKNNIFGINSKFLFAGGSRYTPVNLEQSKLAGYTIQEVDKTYTEQVAPYLRLDLGLSYKINAKKVTHSISVDIQNVINYQNIYSQYYNAETEKLEYFYQGGIFPNLNYKINF
ncbi:MAG: TonB-dependent receptor [Aureispira sp.]|nr:TonB-dependent receptor [Aureispira sp.]